MCILFIYTNPNPGQGKYQLIVATNRDEYYTRPAAAAHQWPEDELVFAGKDMEPGREGGTWFGVSFRQTAQFKLRIAALLNVTGEEKRPGAAGRGSIVTDYLKSDLTACDYIKQYLQPTADKINTYSFVATELNNDEVPQILHYTNVTNRVTSYNEVSANVIGFGNSLPEEPFVKVREGEKRLYRKLSELNTVDQRNVVVTELRDVLRWKEQHLPDPVLARRAPDTTEILSSVFVDYPKAGYGTRTHTIVLVDESGHVEVMEETMESYSDSNWLFNSFQTRI